MPIPDYQSIMLPLLKYCSDGQEKNLRHTINGLAKEFQLADSELKELLPSGRQSSFDNRVGWARTYLSKAGLLEVTKRAHFRITDRGKQTLSENLVEIKNSYLRQFDEFNSFISSKSNDTSSDSQTVKDEIETPEELIENTFQKLQLELASELVQMVKSCSPLFFEQLVVDLLISMGYGGSRKEAGQAIGNSNDGGIDGIIKEDRLGLDIIYIQAKRWEGTVGRPEIQKFAGALQGQRARKGIFITTSSYSNGAIDYVTNIDTKIILIDGEQLGNLMIEHNIGVSPLVKYEVKRIDSDYFNND